MISNRRNFLRQPLADIRAGAVAALTGVMGEAIYKGRSVTWKDLGGGV